MQDNLNNKILNATKWSAVAEITAKIASPIVNIMLARLLTPSEFGVIASITIITSFADIFTDAGFQKFVIQHEFAGEEALVEYSDVAFTSNVILSVLIYGLIFIFRHTLASAVGCSGEYNGLTIAALTVLCTSFSSISVARFRRDLNFKPLFYIRLGSSFIPLIITVPFAFVLKNYWAIVIGTVFQQVFIAVMAIKLSSYKPRLRFDLRLFSAMVSFSMWNLMETLSIWFAGQANIFIVAGALTTYYLGLYKTGMATINSYMSIITSAITPVLFSALARVQNNKKSYNNTFNKFQKIVAIFVMPMGMGVLLYRNLAVQLLLGTQWKEIAGFMGLWAFMSALTITFSNTACEVYRSMGKPKVSCLLQLMYLVIYIPVIYYSAHKSFAALCYAGCFVRVVPIFLDFLTLNFKFKISLQDIIRNTYAPLIAVAIMAMIGILFQHISDSLLWQFFSICICAGIYFIVLLIFPNTRSDVYTIKQWYNIGRK